MAIKSNPPDPPGKRGPVQTKINKAAAADLPGEVLQEVNRYRRLRRYMLLCVVAFGLGALLLSWYFIQTYAFVPLGAGEHLNNVMAGSADGSKLAVVVDSGVHRKLLLSVDSGKDFSAVANWGSYRVGKPAGAMAMTPDEKKVLVVDSPSVHIISLETGNDVVVPLPRYIVGNTGYTFEDGFPIEIRCVPNHSTAYIFKHYHGLCILDWGAGTIVGSEDNGQKIQTLGVNQAGVHLVAGTLELNGNSGDTLFIGPDLHRLRPIGLTQLNINETNMPSWFRDIYYDEPDRHWFYTDYFGLYRLLPSISDSLQFYIQQKQSIWEIGKYVFNPAGLWYFVHADSIFHLDTGYRVSSTQVVPYADSIIGMSFGGGQLAHVLIQNGGVVDSGARYYLFSRLNGSWGFNAIANKKAPGPWLPWISLLMVVSLILFFRWVLMTRQKARVIDVLINSQPRDNEMKPKIDQPVTTREEDLLGFDPLAAAIVDLLRNPETGLPFTMVISGGWGSGKSSMMNLIRSHLEKRDENDGQYYITWFNAWHMQDERSLLDTFLLHMINCYERNAPYILSSFRLTLAAKRFFRLNWLTQLALGFALGLLAPFVIFGLIRLLVPNAIITTFLPFVDTYWNELGRIFGLHDLGFQGFKTYSTLSAIALAFFSILFLTKKFSETGLGAFVKLLPKRPFNLEVESREIGYREDFKREYWQIMDSAKQGSRLVVFIDDVDRIRGDKVLELLEAINFVNDTASAPGEMSKRKPNTIFVLGMFVQEVAKNLGNSLKKAGSDGGNGDATDAMLLGSRYIEKMVQMIIPVPFENSSPRINELYANKDDQKPQ